MDGDREIRYGQATGEVSTAPPMPEETTAGESVQPEEEDEAEIKGFVKLSWNKCAIWSVSLRMADSRSTTVSLRFA